MFNAKPPKMDYYTIRLHYKADHKWDIRLGLTIAKKSLYKTHY